MARVRANVGDEEHQGDEHYTEVTSAQTTRSDEPGWAENTRRNFACSRADAGQSRFGGCL